MVPFPLAQPVSGPVERAKAGRIGIARDAIVGPDVGHFIWWDRRPGNAVSDRVARNGKTDAEPCDAVILRYVTPGLDATFLR